MSGIPDAVASFDLQELLDHALTTGRWRLDESRGARRPGPQRVRLKRGCRKTPGSFATSWPLPAGTARAPVTVRRGARRQLREREKVEILPAVC